MPQPSFVIEGPRWFRSQIRRKGPFVALLPPVVLGAVALVCIHAFTTQATGVIGLVTAYFAAPALPALGAPFSASSRYPLAVGLSAALWLVVGFVAARRATRDPMACWIDYWRNYAWIAVGVWVGTMVPMVIARYGIGGALF